MSEDNRKEEAQEEDGSCDVVGSPKFTEVVPHSQSVVEEIGHADDDSLQAIVAGRHDEDSPDVLNSTDGSFGSDLESVASEKDITHPVTQATSENLQTLENDSVNGCCIDHHDDASDENQNTVHADHDDISNTFIRSVNSDELSPTADLGAEATDHQDEPSNPFGDDECDESDINDTNTTKLGFSSTNPFDNDEDDDQSEKKESDIKSAIKVPLGAMKKPFNPFDDGENEEADSVDAEKVHQSKSKVTESKATVTQPSKLVVVRATPAPTNHHEVPVRTYSNEHQELMTLGFDKMCVGNALNKASGDVAVAQNLLMSRLFDDHILSSEEKFVWKSPVMVRVGGWLPNVQDSTGATHTSFFINVTMTLGNESWRIGHRYSEFHRLYSSVYYKLCKAFPSGMRNPFPADRVSNWLSLLNQETINDTRRNALDYWLKELCNCPQMMLDIAVHNSVFEFLAVDENMSKMKKVPPVKVPKLISEKSRTAATPDAANLYSKSSTVRSSVDAADAASPTELPRNKYSLPHRGDSSASSAADKGTLSPSQLSREESSESANRRMSAIAAQKNDYNSSLSYDLSTVLRNSEPSSSGFTDVRSKSFAKRVNPKN